MDPNALPNPSSAAEVDYHERRKRSLVDALYLLVSVWLYVISLFYPLVGIVLGVVFMNWATTDDVRRMGRTCLIRDGYDEVRSRLAEE
jgi:hypothetical protein